MKVKIENCKIEGLKEDQAIELAPNPWESIRRLRIIFGLQSEETIYKAMEKK